MNMTDRTYWTDCKVSRKRERLGPFATREEAEAAARKVTTKPKSIMTGYGSEGPCFDIQWPEPAGLF
jgi:hypothetical protein